MNNILLVSMNRRTLPSAKCHPSRAHYARGKCRACYNREYQAKAKKIYKKKRIKHRFPF